MKWTIRAVLLSLALSGIQAAAPPADASASAADGLVRTDLIVRDSRGRMVRNLEPGDLVVSEDGSKATLRNLHFQNEAKAGQPHLITLLFEDLSGELGRFSREGAISVLAAKTANTRVAVYRVGDRIEALQGFTGDLKALRAAVELATGRKHGKGTPAPAPEASGLAFSTGSILHTAAKVSRDTRARPLIAALLALATEQGRAPGRKAIVLFSQGAGIGGASQDALRAVISTANRAGVAIYAVDAASIATTSRIAQARESMMIQLQPFGMQDVTIQGPGRAGQLGRTPNYQHAQDGAGINPDRPVDRGPLPPLARLASGTGGFVVSRHDNFRGPLRQVPEEVASYYTLDYLPADSRIDGRFRAVRVDVEGRKLRVHDREGYYAAPVIPGAISAAFELPLMEMLRKGPSQDFRHIAGVGHFRNAETGQPVTTISLEVRGREVEFSEEPGGGLFRAHISALAVIRGKDGAIVDKFIGDTPVQCPPRMVDEMKDRYFVFQEQFELAPGQYTLETILQDRISGRFSSSRQAVAVGPTSPSFGVGSVSLVRHVTTADENQAGSPYLADGKRIVPALDGHVDGGKGARAQFFVRLYPDPARHPAYIEIKVLRDGKLVQGSQVQIPVENDASAARLLSVGIGALAPGTYQVQLAASSGGIRIVQELPLVIEKGVSIFSRAASAASPAQAGTEVESAADVPSTPPTAEQQKLLESARQSAMQYAGKLPNFICTQVTRRMLDTAAKNRWQTMEEEAQLVTFYDGQEHYHNLTTDARQTRDKLPSMTSSGEFGTILKQIFRSESKAKFAWVRNESIRGRAVQVYTYDVDASNGQYRVGYNGNEFNAPVFTGFHGLVFIDEQTAVVVRLTHETATLPERFPIRQFALTVDYDDISVGGKPYILPVSATLNLRLRKRTLIRNEVSFRSYQRFTTESRVLSFDPQQPQQPARQAKP